MSNIVKLETLQGTRRTVRHDLPEGGAMILLFTGVQYVRDEADLRMYERLRATQFPVHRRGQRTKPRKAKGLRKVATKH
ncbi:MAG: hypothetical protein KDJ29_11220 [Hyphomicrobiales bacterium]|nr:hypothetical protein [Hyphomicrobiales bacterium]